MAYSPSFSEPASREPAAARRVSETTWAQARDEYLAGESGPAVCARFGIGLTTFRERARLDGWRRTDMKDSTLTSHRDVLPASAAYTDMAAEAGMRMREALARGRAADVVSWMRVQDQLADRVGQDTAAFLETRRSSPGETGGLRLIHDTLARLIHQAQDADPGSDADLADGLDDLAALSKTLDEIENEADDAGLRSS